MDRDRLSDQELTQLVRGPKKIEQTASNAPVRVAKAPESAPRASRLTDDEIDAATLSNKKGAVRDVKAK